MPLNKVKNINFPLKKPFCTNNNLTQLCIKPSGFLVIFCMNNLAKEIRHNEKIEGVKIDNVEKKIGLVAYDTVLTVKKKIQCLTEVAAVLVDFEKQSGLKINYEKSTLCHIGTQKQNHTVALPRTFQVV